MKKRAVGLMVVFLFLVLAVAGCGKKEEQLSDYYIYYLNKEKTKLVPIPYEPASLEKEAMVEDLLDKLKQNPKSIECRKTLTKGTEVISWAIEQDELRLNFGSEYSQLSQVEEVLCRAAVVRTLIQIEGIEYVSFYVGDAPLMDKNGNVVGLMRADSFIENPGEQINSIQTATITLYFPNEKGNALVKEIQECHYNSNISLEKLVLEQLAKGPADMEGRSPIPEGTTLLSVSVLDGVCFVNFDQVFLKSDSKLKGNIIIYSIVNSLAELPDVNKVQFSINGETNITFRKKFPFDTIYERNLDDLIGTEESEEKVVRTNEEQEGATVE